jgi:hypothetical protein
VNFPTKVQNSSSTAIDNIFVDSARLNSSYTSPIISGLSDHHINKGINLALLTWILRKINNETIAQLQCLLANEIWDTVFKN